MKDQQEPADRKTSTAGRTDWPIYVPSKDRAGACPTVELLTRAGLRERVRLVVEPQDRGKYDGLYGVALVTLGRNDAGLAYARNAVLAAARQEGAAWAWMIDDDLSGFYEVREQRCVRSDAATVLGTAEDILTREHARLCDESDDETAGIGQAALEYQQFAWSARTPFRYDSYCDVAVALHLTALGGRQYRPVEPKEDRDFTLQVLASGRRTVRTAQLGFGTVPIGSQRGGLYSVYQQGREATAVEALRKAWGDDVIRAVQKRGGRIDAKINWRRAWERTAHERSQG